MFFLGDKRYNMNALWANYHSKMFCWHVYIGWYKQVHFYNFIVIPNCLKSIFKTIFTVIPNRIWSPNDLLATSTKTTNLVPIWKEPCNNPTFGGFTAIYPWYMIIFLHIDALRIKQYCFICSSPCSTNLLLLVQTTISKYLMCKVWRLSNAFFNGNHFKSSSFPQLCVQSYERRIYRRRIHQLHPYHNLYFDA